MHLHWDQKTSKAKRWWRELLNKSHKRFVYRGRGVRVLCTSWGKTSVQILCIFVCILLWSVCSIHLVVFWKTHWLVIYFKFYCGLICICNAYIYIKKNGDMRYEKILGAFIFILCNSEKVSFQSQTSLAARHNTSMSKQIIKTKCSAEETPVFGTFHTFLFLKSPFFSQSIFFI